MAIERGYEYYFWGHSDVAVLGKDESASFADDVIACVEASFKSRPNWGIIYFNYDWFSAIRTDLVRQVRNWKGLSTLDSIRPVTSPLYS